MVTATGNEGHDEGAAGVEAGMAAGGGGGSIAGRRGPVEGIGHGGCPTITFGAVLAKW
jgi:hypothetical protein